jgi:hypothetical protein
MERDTQVQMSRSMKEPEWGNERPDWQKPLECRRKEEEDLEGLWGGG